MLSFALNARALECDASKILKLKKLFRFGITRVVLSVLIIFFGALGMHRIASLNDAVLMTKYNIDNATSAARRTKHLDHKAKQYGHQAKQWAARGRAYESESQAQNHLAILDRSAGKANRMLQHKLERKCQVARQHSAELKKKEEDAREKAEELKEEAEEERARAKGFRQQKLMVEQQEQADQDKRDSLMRVVQELGPILLATQLYAKQSQAKADQAFAEAQVARADAVAEAEKAAEYQSEAEESVAEAATDEEDEAEAGGVAAATEWIPGLDLIDDVGASAIAVGLEADAARSTAIAAAEETKAAEEGIAVARSRSRASFAKKRGEEDEAEAEEAEAKASSLTRRQRSERANAARVAREAKEESAKVEADELMMQVATAQATRDTLAVESDVASLTSIIGGLYSLNMTAHELQVEIQTAVSRTEDFAARFQAAVAKAAAYLSLSLAAGERASANLTAAERANSASSAELHAADGAWIEAGIKWKAAEKSAHEAFTTCLFAIVCLLLEAAVATTSTKIEGIASTSRPLLGDIEGAVEPPLQPEQPHVERIRPWVPRWSIALFDRAVLPLTVIVAAGQPFFQCAVKLGAFESDGTEHSLIVRKSLAKGVVDAALLSVGCGSFLYTIVVLTGVWADGRSDRVGPLWLIGTFCKALSFGLGLAAVTTLFAGPASTWLKYVLPVCPWSILALGLLGQARLLLGCCVRHGEGEDNGQENGNRRRSHRWYDFGAVFESYLPEGVWKQAWQCAMWLGVQVAAFYGMYIVISNVMFIQGQLVPLLPKQAVGVGPRHWLRFALDVTLCFTILAEALYLTKKAIDEAPALLLLVQVPFFVLPAFFVFCVTIHF